MVAAWRPHRKGLEDHRGASCLGAQPDPLAGASHCQFSVISHQLGESLQLLSPDFPASEQHLCARHRIPQSTGTPLSRRGAEKSSGLSLLTHGLPSPFPWESLLSADLSFRADCPLLSTLGMTQCLPPGPSAQALYFHPLGAGIQNE